MKTKTTIRAVPTVNVDPMPPPSPLTVMAPRSRAANRARTSTNPSETDTLPELIACAISVNDDAEGLAVACLSALAEDLDLIAYVSCRDVTENAAVYFLPERISQLTYWAARRPEARTALVAHFERLKSDGEK